MATSQLFDVVLFNTDGTFFAYAGQDIPFSGALAMSRGVNDHRKRTGPTAVVVPKDYYEGVIAKDVEAYHLGIDAATLTSGELQDAKNTLEAIRDLASDIVGESESEPNALDEQDDSTVEDDSENATQSKPAGSVFDEVSAKRAKFVRKQFRKQLRRIWDAVPLIDEPSDLGIVAASLETLAKAMNGVTSRIYEDFDYALCGDLRYDELEAALGVVR